MEVIIIADPEILPLQSQIEKNLAGIVGPNKIYVVQAEMSKANNPNQRFAGLEEAIRLAENISDPIILISIVHPWNLADDRRWQAAMGYPNVDFCDSLNLEELPNIVESCFIKTKTKDDLAISLVNFTEEELAREGLFASTKIKGIFIDIDSLLIKDEDINLNLILLIRALARGIKPLTIISETVSDDLKEIIRDRKITAKILPKKIFKGAILEEVYSSKEQKEFSDAYSIEADDFHSII